MRIGCLIKRNKYIIFVKRKGMKDILTSEAVCCIGLWIIAPLGYDK